MYKYFRVYELGFYEGFKDAIKDLERKSFSEINILDIMSKLYDIGYIDGYNKCFNYIKNVF